MRFNPPVESVGTRLKQARKLRHMTQPELAALSGVKQPTISKIERGDIQRPTELYELARALRCNPDWLSKGTGDMEGMPSGGGALPTVASALSLLYDTIKSVDGIARSQTIAAIKYFLDHPEEWRQAAQQIEAATGTLGGGQHQMPASGKRAA